MGLIEVKPEPDGKSYGVWIGDHLLGTTKLQCDALFHKYQLEKVINVDTAVVEKNKS